MEEKFGDMFRNFYEWEDLESRKCFPAPSGIEAGGDESGEELYLPGGGIAKPLYEDL